MNEIEQILRNASAWELAMLQAMGMRLPTDAVKRMKQELQEETRKIGQRDRSGKRM